MVAEPGTQLGTFFVGMSQVQLQLPGSGSLKGKRAILNKAKAALKRELDASVSEIGYQELWQRAALGVVVAGSSETSVQRALDRVIAVLERDPRLVVTRADEGIETF